MTHQTDNADLGRRAGLFLFVLVLLLTVAVRIRLLGVPLERDEGEYAYFGQLLLQGIPPYLEAYTMKLPGVAAMYALIMMVFGQTVQGIHLGLLLTSMLSTGLLLLVGRKLFDAEIGYLAASVFLLLSITPHTMGAFAHATHFIALFGLAGVLLLLAAMEKPRPALLFASGCMFGLAILMKQHAAFLAMFACIAICWARPSAEGRGWTGRLTAVAILVTGIVLPYLLVACWLALAGTFDKFWFWTAVYPREYVSYLTIIDGVKSFSHRVNELSGSFLPLWLLGGGGLIALFAKQVVPFQRWFLLGFFVASFLLITPGYYYRGHYFLAIFPAFSLLAALCFRQLCCQAVTVWRSGVVRPGIYLLLAVAIGISAYQERFYLFQAPMNEVSSLVYLPFAPFVASVKIGEFLKKETAPTDRIAVLGSEPQVFFYANRRSVSGHIYMYGLLEEQKHAFRMQQELISDIERHRPPWIVLFNLDSSWTLMPGSITMVLNWAQEYTRNNYDLHEVIDLPDAPKIFENDEISFSDSHPGRSIYIFRRKAALAADKT